MIKLSKVQKESRKRDIKRNRVILQVGGLTIHISREEAKELGKQIIRILNS